MAKEKSELTATDADPLNETGAGDPSIVADAPPPPAASEKLKGKQPGPKALVSRAASAPTVKDFRCSVPGDSTLPARIVQALTAGDAEQKYKADLGIVVIGHTISVANLTDGE